MNDAQKRRLVEKVTAEFGEDLRGKRFAIWGLAFAPRNDAFGAIVYLCLLRFLLVGRAPLVYAGAFLICSYLELLGTSVGTWAWAPHDASGLLGVGNPPSGIAGGYCFLDMVGIYVATRLATAMISGAGEINNHFSAPPFARLGLSQRPPLQAARNYFS